MARSFGSGNTIDLGSGPFPTTGSFVCLFKPNWAKTDSVNHILFYVADSDVSFITQKFSDNTIIGGWMISGDHRVIVSSSNYTLNQNAWNAWAVTWDDTANETKFYLNGTLIGTNTAALNTHDTTGRLHRLGHSAFNLDGHVAEVGFYNRVLTSTEVSTLASFYRPSTISSGLVNYWSFETDLLDSVGGVTATNSGTTLSTHPTMLSAGGPGGKFLPFLMRKVKDLWKQMKGGLWIPDASLAR